MQTKFATAMTCYDNVFSLSSFRSILSSQKACRTDSIDVSPHCTSIPGRALAGHVRRCTVLIGSQNSCGTHTHTHTHSTHLFPQHSCLQLSSITCYLAPAVFFYTILSEATMLCFQASSFHLLSFSSSILGFSCATDGRLRSKRVCFKHIWLEQ